MEKQDFFHYSHTESKTKHNPEKDKNAFESPETLKKKANSRETRGGGLEELEVLEASADQALSKVNEFINNASDEVFQATGEKPSRYFTQIIEKLKRHAEDLAADFKHIAAYAKIGAAAGLLVGCTESAELKTDSSFETSLQGGARQEEFFASDEEKKKEHDKEWERIKNIVPPENEQAVRDIFRRVYFEPVDQNISSDSLVTTDPHTHYLTKKETEKFREDFEMPEKPNVTGQFMLPDKQTGYIKLDKFYAGSSLEVQKAVAGLKEQNLQRLILDLRYNGGGYMHEALDIVDEFVSQNELILSSKGKSPWSNQDYYSSTRSDWDGPLIVLVNYESASSSEIVAGALQDIDRAVIVGEMTFGKGLIQSQYRFKNGDCLMITTGKYFTPSGRSLQRPYVKWVGKDKYYDAAYDAAERASLIDSAKTYQTTGDRIIYGENGVMPDTTISDQTFPKEIRKIIDYHLDTIASFAQTFVEGNTLPEDLEDFLADFSVDEKILAEFKQAVIEADTRTRDGKISKPLADTAFDAPLKNLLAREIAYAKHSRAKVQWQTDEELRAAVGVFEAPLFTKITQSAGREKIAVQK